MAIMKIPSKEVCLEIQVNNHMGSVIPRPSYNPTNPLSASPFGDLESMRA